MEMAPKWEDLNMDCLVNILGRVDMETRLLDVPYVCKSWYKATCDPQCWTILDFTGSDSVERASDDEGIINFGSVTDECAYNDEDIPESGSDKYVYNDEYDYHDECIPESFSKRLVRQYRLFKSSDVTSFIKYVVKRANGLVTVLKLPPICTQEALVYVSNECRNLRTLNLPVADMDNDQLYTICSAVSKWKGLENLSMLEIRPPEILEQISIHCNNFETLEILNGSLVGEVEASALVTFLPDLKALSLRHTYISKVNLLKILNGCKKLEYLDLTKTRGFDEDDDEILKSAAHIRTLKLECQKLFFTVEYNNLSYYW